MAYRGPSGRFVSQEDWEKYVRFQMSGQVNPGSLFREAINKAEGDLRKKYGRYLRALYSSASLNEGINDVNKRVMEGAQAAVLEKYGASGIGKRPSYRQNDTGKMKRYSDGAMEKALSGEGFFRVAGNKWFFANKTMMDSKAKQWYRLNFGASPKGSSEPKVGDMKMPRSLGGKKSNKKVEFKGYKPSSRFRVPNNGPGIWSGDFRASSAGAKVKPVYANSGARGRHALYVGTNVIAPGKKWFRARKNGTMKNRYSVGIRGKRFLDAGARYINENYPRELGKAVTAWDRKSRRKLRGT